MNTAQIEHHTKRANGLRELIAGQETAIAQALADNLPHLVPDLTRKLKQYRKSLKECETKLNTL